MANLKHGFGGRADVSHKFQGDQELANNTFDRRMEIRELLVALQEEVRALSGDTAQVSIAADIKITISTDPVKQHIYRVDVDGGLAMPSQARENGNNAVPAFEEPLDSSARRQSLQAHAADLYSTRSPYPQQPFAKVARRLTSSSNKNHVDHPNKRKRTEDLPGSSEDQGRRSAARSVEPSDTPSPGSTPDMAHMMKFLQEWRQQWLQQGGWMYDHFNKMTDDERRKKLWTEKGQESLQATLSSILSLQHTQTMGELGGIAKQGIPWIEQCRKVDHEAAQTREEKWRISSATFHDQARRDRETAEKSLMLMVADQKDILQRQQKMLLQLMESQGLDMEAIE